MLTNIPPKLWDVYPTHWVLPSVAETSAPASPKKPGAARRGEVPAPWTWEQFAMENCLFP